MGFHYFDDWPVKAFDWLDLPIGSECELGFNWGKCDTVHRGVTQEEILNTLQKLR